MGLAALTTTQCAVHVSTSGASCASFHVRMFYSLTTDAQILK